MADGQPSGRPWWQWILIALLIIGIIYLIFSLFALGRNQSRIGLTTPTPTEGAEEITEEPTPTTEVSPTKEPTRKPATTTPTRPPSTKTPSPTGAIQQTPQTGP